MAKLELSIDYVLENEGGYTVDDGGPTMWGIVITDVAQYRKVSPLTITVNDMKALSKAEAIEIYRQQYWDKMRLNEVVSQNVATCIFDTAVNRGIGVAVKYTQRVCNSLGSALVVDGQMGLHTLYAVNSTLIEPFIRRYEDMEAAGYLAIIAYHPDYKLYEAGWMARARRLLTLIPQVQETLSKP